MRSLELGAYSHLRIMSRIGGIYTVIRRYFVNIAPARHAYCSICIPRDHVGVRQCAQGPSTGTYWVEEPISRPSAG